MLHLGKRPGKAFQVTEYQEVHADIKATSPEQKDALVQEQIAGLSRKSDIAVSPKAKVVFVLPDNSVFYC